MKLKYFLALFLSQLLTVTAVFGTATVKFSNPVVYGAGGQGTNFVVAADLNGDGFPDMVIANSDGVSVRLNNTDGTFAPPVTYGTGGTKSFAVAVGDVNGDGVPDLVVSNGCSNSPGCSMGGVGVLIGVGDGTFLTAVPYDAGGTQTRAVVIGDVNNDGAADIIVTSDCQVVTCVDGSIRLLTNNGDGTFTLVGAQVSPSMGGPLAIGDLNGDGCLDLVADVGVLLGNCDGTFQPQSASVPGGTISIALGDVNGDGFLDMVVADQVSVKVQLGGGDGTLGPAVTFAPGGKRPLAVALADFNGDGTLDIAVANECSSLTNGACSNTGSVGVLPGNGDGTFAAFVKYGSGGYFATSVAVGDANQDTKSDIFVSNVCPTPSTCNTHGNVGVLLNIFKAAVTVQVASSSNPAYVNQPFDLTATLTSPVPVPDNSPVNFFYNGNLIGSGTTTGGVATASGISFSAYGPHTITAKYAGDIYHSAGSGSMTQMVPRYPTTTTVTTNDSPEQHGQPVPLTATVTSSGPSVPTGTVTFKNGNTTLGTKTLSGGTATLTTKTLPVGTLTITAIYNGDSQSATSSGSGTQVIY